MSSATAFSAETTVVASMPDDALPFAEKTFRVISLTLTFAFPALLCLCIAYVAEPDIWWHLTSGEWMLAHHTFPRVDTFSYTTAGHPWQAYSWLFEVLFSKLYTHFGLVGIVAYTTTMVLAITSALFCLIHSSQKSLRIALPLTLLSAFAMLTLFSPRPWHFTILFFILELAMLQKARKTGALRPLLLLPVLFALWANLHIQFIDGLLLHVLLLVESILFSSQRGRVSGVSQITPRAAAALLFACICATLINPYGWHIYSVAHDLAAQKGVVNGIEELKAMPFRSLSNYVVLFLVLAATVVMARSRRFRFFETALLLAATILSFRSQRDIWLAVIVSAAVLAEGLNSGDSEHAYELSNGSIAVASGVAALLLCGAAHLVRISDATLQPKLASAMPADAVAYVREHKMQGPIFCDFIWGGYLMHSLHLPVSIDGRAALHGDEQLDLSSRTWAGEPEWSSNPQLGSAGVIVARRSAALTQLLRTDSRFDRVYEDKLAVVFVRHQQLPITPGQVH